MTIKIPLFNILMVNFLRFKASQHILLRRLLAFFIDILSLFCASAIIAGIGFVLGFDLSSYTFISFVLFFLLFRIFKKGRTIGMIMCRLQFEFYSLDKYIKLRLIYRFSLNLLCYIFFLNFISIIKYLFPILFVNFKIILLIVSFLLSIPLINILWILFTKGQSSIIDRLVSCSISTVSSKTFINHNQCSGISLKNVIGIYLITASMLYLILLCINWDINLKTFFSDKFFDPVLNNPLTLISRKDVFERFNKPNSPILALVVNKPNHITPYLSSDLDHSKKVLMVYLTLSNNIFNDKEAHKDIAREVELSRLLYNLLDDNNIGYSLLVLIKSSSFGFISFISKYTYLIEKSTDGIFLLGYSQTYENHNDTCILKTKYINLQDVNPEGQILFNFQYVYTPYFGLFLSPQIPQIKFTPEGLIVECGM